LRLGKKLAKSKIVARVNVRKIIAKKLRKDLKSNEGFFGRC
jgi:hypothetical protein